MLGLWDVIVMDICPYFLKKVTNNTIRHLHNAEPRGNLPKMCCTNLHSGKRKCSMEHAAIPKMYCLQMTPRYSGFLWNSAIFRLGGPSIGPESLNIQPGSVGCFVDFLRKAIETRWYGNSLADGRWGLLWEKFFCRNRSLWQQFDVGVSKNRGTPNGWFMMENPIKMHDLGVPLFSETSMYCRVLLHVFYTPEPKTNSFLNCQETGP